MSGPIQPQLRPQGLNQPIPPIGMNGGGVGNQSFVLMEPEQALQKFDEMKATVELMREDIRHLLKSAGTFVSSKATPQSLLNQTKTGGERMRKLTSLGKETNRDSLSKGD
eukprot:TRINITY_DN7498_c0_g1_i1.p1 TRINITY_DN7498_c0_g1~~TRINITY_DN7498_c0_g1_i1.p1  ORF type:complete len:118 (-),score=42.71 TRINITY_DN7498_c0_g1_i1:77-406(-)